MGLATMDYEYRLIDAGTWELEALHETLAQLSEEGWNLDEAYTDPAGAPAEAGLHLWLRRPRAEARRVA